MTSREIIDQLAHSKEIEKIVYKMMGNSKNPIDCPDDLIQDIYLILLTKPPELIEGLYERNELGFYILTIAKNQIFSVNSPYYTNYIKPAIYDQIEEYKETIPTTD